MKRRFEGRIRQGKLITFEGSEGCGKSTQIRLLYNFLKSRGYRVVILREPGGTKVGEEIRRILLSPENNKISKEVEMLLYMSARGQLIREVIQPRLKAGFIVLCDRFLDSTLAYQGYGCGMNLKEIEAAGNLVLKGISPDLTILLDMKIEDALKRSGRNDRIEKRPLSYHRKVRRGYLALARRFPRRIKIVRGDNEITKTRDEIRRIVLNVLERAHRSG